MGVLIIYVLIFLVLIALSMPIAFSLGISSVVAFIMTERSLELLTQRLWTGLDAFTLVAIPLFILTGELMGSSGILSRLLDFARLVVGRIKGGLLYINIFVSMLFGGVNGSAVADTSAVGSMLIPATKREYNDPELTASVTAVSSIVGPIIPPSLPMLIYAFAASNVPVAALFLAGIVPGIVVGLALIIVTFFIIRKKNYSKDEKRYKPKDIAKILLWFLVTAILPFVMVAGIVSGVMTPTESGCIGIIYALIVGFFITKELTFAAIYKSFVRTVMITAIVMIMVSIGNVSTWWLSVEDYPNMISSMFENFTENPYMFLLLMVLLYLLIGLFIEQAAAMIMLVPIFAPLAASYGIQPEHFGIVTCLALAVGLITPPVGLCLFVSSSIAQVPIERVFKATTPYLVTMALVLIFVAYFPKMYLWVPALFGY